VRLDFLALHPAEEALASGPRPTRPGPQTPSPGSARDTRATAGLPAAYIPDAKHRIEFHRRFAQITDPAGLRRLKDELRDRFGPPPPPVELLLQVAELRLFAAALGIETVESRDEKLMLRRNGEYVQFGGKFPRLGERDARGRLQEIRRFLGALPASTPTSAVTRDRTAAP
jgi:transcription-repair coupling factor (superfamily II helicase)